MSQIKKESVIKFINPLYLLLNYKMRVFIYLFKLRKAISDLG
jgi:hypothetical protein